MKADYTIICAPTFKSPGIVANNITGEDFTIWKVKYNTGVAYEDSDGNRFSTIIALINKKVKSVTE